jgi:hypothetical protein
MGYQNKKMQELQEQWKTSAVVIAFHWAVSVPLFFILLSAKDALWASVMFVGGSIAILAAAWVIIKFKSEHPQDGEKLHPPLVMVKRWERKLETQLCVGDDREGFSLTRIEAREEPGWPHDEMFLSWSDGTTTVMTPDQWDMDMANALDVLRRKGKRFKKIGKLLGPPLTKEEFDDECIKMFGRHPDER